MLSPVFELRVEGLLVHNHWPWKEISHV